jgi:hypothetical protein
MNWTNINWGSVADWVSGLGSMSAGIIALYLARESQRIHLQGYCGLRVLVGGGGPKQDLVSISVTNIGTRATIINNVSIRVGLFKKRLAIITIPKDAFSVGIPYSLADGHAAHWGISLDQNKSWLRDLCKDFILNKNDVRTLRFRIHTNHGDFLTLKPEKPLRNAIIEILKEKSD